MSDIKNLFKKGGAASLVDKSVSDLTENIESEDYLREYIS